MVMETVTHVCASDFCQLKAANVNVDSLVVTYSAKLPCIVNTTPIKAGEEAIVKWAMVPTARKHEAATKEIAFDQLAGLQKKARRERK